MKFIANLAVILLLPVVVNCQSNSDYQRVDESEIDRDLLTFVTELSDKILTSQKNGEFYKLTEEEASSKMVAALDENLQKQSYEQIRNAFGDYQGLDFHQLLESSSGALYKIYRFKGQFSPGAEVEVRAVLDTENKLAGFFVTSWKDSL